MNVKKYIEVVGDHITSCSSESIFASISLICDHFSTSDTLPLTVVKNLFANVSNLHKRINKKIKAHSFLSNLRNSGKEKQFLETEVEFNFSIKKPGPKIGASKSFCDLQKSAKYRKLSLMSSSNSPSSNVGFSLHTFNKFPEQIKPQLNLSATFNKLTSLECVSLLTFLNISVSKYNVLKNFFESRRINFFLGYDALLSYKKQNIYIKSDISENSIISTFSDMLKKTLPFILSSSSLVPDIPIDIHIK